MSVTSVWLPEEPKRMVPSFHVTMAPVELPPESVPSSVTAKRPLETLSVPVKARSPATSTRTSVGRAS